jgi:S-DNA-T family DNA segregation ATPase FtsK/SpoIIIE
MIHSIPNAYRTPAATVYTPFLRLAERPHLLIAGATGSGKSVALNGVITSLLMTESPFHVQFVLIDPKKVELSQYARLPHCARYASEHPDIVRALQWAVDETDRRFTRMQRAGIKEYDGPHLYVVIDELADLMVSIKKETLPLLQRLAQIGRAARVHVIACSQNILAQTIPTVLKCNFSTILGLRTCNAQQSRFLISATGCEMLPDPKREGKGYGYLRDGADLEKMLIYKYPEKDIDAMITWWTSSACIAS